MVKIVILVIETCIYIYIYIYIFKLFKFFVIVHNFLVLIFVLVDYHEHAMLNFY